MESSIIPDWLYQKRHSTTLAVEYDNTTWSYQELFEHASRLAGKLHVVMGVGAGDRVALIARDGLVFAATLHALMQLDAIVVPINTRLSSNEVAWQLRDACARLVVSDEAHADFAHQVRERLGDSERPDGITMRGEFWESDAPPVYRRHVDMEQVHAIVYTSGTTGFPKGAMITYGNHFWGAVGSSFRLGMVLDDRWLIPMPLFHVGGLAVLMRSLIYGTAVEIHAQFDPARVMDSLRHKRVTLLSVVAVMLQRMLAWDHSPFPEGVRAVLLGGGPAPRTLLDECVAKRVPVQFSYGLTESNSQAATLSLSDSLRKLGSAGQPLMMNEIRIEYNGQAQSVGKPGEILLRGPTVVKGYFGRPEATAEAFRGGWLHTGDIGWLDDEGYLYVLDRRQDLIISGGENVYPAEVEAVLHEHEGILEAGVAGIDDEEFGSVPFAVVRLKQGVSVTEEEIKQYCAFRLAKYKVPRTIRFSEELPRNAAGKLLRRELVKWL